MLEHCEIAHIGIDPVIFSIREGKLVVLLQQREKEPFAKKYELPGGLVTVGEDATDTIKRKLAEVLGKEVYFTQFETFTSPKRDPRVRIVSIGYVAIVHIEDISSDEWYELDALPSLAFDHSEIITSAHTFLKDHLHELLAKQFLPKEFPLNDLQTVYEAISGEEFDNRNFRRKMISSGIVVETGKLEQDVSHRPAKLFKFKT